MKAILRTYIEEEVASNEIIEIDERYDFGKGPHAEENEDFCPVVGSNQAIIEA